MLPKSENPVLRAEESPRVLGTENPQQVLGNPRKSEKVTEATLRLESLTHSSLNGGNVTEARMGITLSKWMSGKLDILGTGQP